MVREYVPTYLTDMAKRSKNFFCYLTQIRVANILRQIQHETDNSHVSSPGPREQFEVTDRAFQAPAEASVHIGPNLVDLFKQSEKAMRRLRSTRRQYEKSAEPSETVQSKLQIDQSTYDGLQEKFHEAFLQILAEANLLDVSEIESVSSTLNHTSSLSDEDLTDAGKEMLRPLDKEAQPTEENLISSTEAENSAQDVEVAEWHAKREAQRQIIQDTKARMMHVKENLDQYEKDETWEAKVDEWETSVEKGECSISRDELRDRYVTQFRKWQQEEAEVEDEFWTAIADAEALGMVVDRYVKDVQPVDEDGSPEESADPKAETRDHYFTEAAFEKFKMQCAVWVEGVPTHEDTDELCYPYQPNRLLPEDNVIDRDIVGTHSGVLFGRPQ